MRKNDIDELLLDVEENLRILHERQQAAVTDPEIHELFKVKVKECLEHLKSVLDYAANDIYEIILNSPELGKGVKVYFPYGINTEDINDKIRKVFPRLSQVNQPVRDLVGSIQTPSQTGWLKIRCSIRNTNSHSRLMKQRREDMAGHSLFNNGITFIGDNFQNIQMINNTYVDGNGSQKYVPHMNVDITDGKSNLNEDELKEMDGNRFDVVEFVFDENNLPVVSLIEEAYGKTKEFVSQLYQMI